MAADFKTVAYPMPPYAINKSLHLAGISVDVLTTIMTMAGHPVDTDKMKLMQCGHAISTARKGPACILLNAMKKKSNRKQFKWVGPMTTIQYVLIGKKTADHDITIPDSLLKHKTATIFNSRSELALTVQGVPTNVLKRSMSFVTPLRELSGGTIDYFATIAASATYQMNTMGMNTDEYGIIAVYKEIPIYFAFSKDVDDELIEKLNNNLQKLKVKGADGTSQYDKILKNYLPNGIIK